MPRFYQPLTLPDGSPNPRHVIDRRERPSGPKLSKFERGEFVAWDGEGVTENGAHRYIMLVSSDDDVLMRNGDALSTRECLALLTERGRLRPNAIHCAFGASYDVNMILADCTHRQIARVWAGEWVMVSGRYMVNYHPRKSFSVRRIGDKRARIVLWDVFGFFQSTFVDALKKYRAIHPDDIALIAQRKQERSAFRVEQLNDILHYCKLECQSLVALMRELRDNLMTAGLRISRWDGAGACAAALLQRQGIVAHKRSRERTPANVLRAAQAAYAGGRTELLQYGHAPNDAVYHYDINSAYPSAMRDCPSLSDGQWQRITDPRAIRQRIAYAADSARHQFCLCYCEWAYDDGAIAYPFFWRSYDSSIFYPQHGSGWHWLPEYLAAEKAMDGGSVRGRCTIRELWDYVNVSGVYPFEWINELFVQRAEWKRSGVGAEKALKLAINSLYGKTAQHVGGTAGQPPRFHQLEWAGFITSCTRATLYNALAPAIRLGRTQRTTRNRGIMLATDAVYSLIPLDVSIGESLGQWSYEKHDGITVVQSGVYWTYNDGKAKPFCRGFDKGSLHRDAIIAAWKRGDVTYDASLTRFITMGSALQGSSTFAENWRQWRTAPRVLALSPDGTKRARITTKAKPAQGLVNTQPAIPAAQLVGQVASAPYALPWDVPNDVKRAQERERLLVLDALDSTL